MRTESIVGMEAVVAVVLICLEDMANMTSHAP
jgi:hypothetical protein